MKNAWLETLGAALLGLACAAQAQAQGPTLANPVMFVTQFPISDDFASIGAVFANHRGAMNSAGRGGDLYIRYPNGSLRNLTQEAGYGMSGLQGANAIAVRDPAVHWSGTKAIFSMVVGAPTQYQWNSYYWQLYEVTGFGQGQTVTITRVPNQPADTNNVEPAYLSNGDIVFVSDRTRDGSRHLYPQHDEYESTPTPTGLWKLVPATGALSLLQHSPSGSFRPLVDRYGRIIFTRWDHLQRDQQADAGNHGNFNWASEAADAPRLATTAEVFPESRYDTATSYGHTINLFLPWMLNQDGSGEETINHIGRHELVGYFNRSLRNDPNLVEFSPGARPNQNVTENWLQLAEDPTVPGRYVAIDAPEFYTHASGQIVAMTAPPDRNADTITVDYLTPRSTRGIHAGTPPADFSGHYRNAIVLADGKLIAARSTHPGAAGNDGTRPNPNPRYKFRLHLLTPSGGSYVPAAGGELTAGISKNISYWDPDVLVSYNGPLWELSPVEVRARAVPPAPTTPLEAPEQAVFAQTGVAAADFKDFLARNDLAALVVRDATTRDDADRQQPFNLRVAGGGKQTVGRPGAIYDIAFLQIFQGDQLRGWTGCCGSQPLPGRRVLAQYLHDPIALAANPAPAGGPPA
ncbi:MAG: hypothetical protein KIS72_11845, partial [Luteimonas sp.]|nr:hypothetical protein [Luteimonas sp.]